MPILEDESQFGLATRSGTGVDPYQEPAAPSLGSVVGAAARTENEIGAGIMYLLREREFEPVDGYNPFADPEFKDTRIADEHGDRFIGVRSPQERRAIERTIEREEADHKIIASSGAMGTIAAIGWGLASPTSFLPGGAIYRAGKIGARAARSAASVGAAAAAGTAVQEAGLQTFTETRTAADSAMAIGGAAALGGILGGGLGVALSRNASGAMDAVAHIADDEHFSPVIGGTRQSVGAAAVADVDTTLKQGFGGAALAKFTSFMTPLQRMQTSDVAASRAAVAQLADPGGVRVVANTAEGGNQAVVPGGSVEMRAKVMQDSILARYYEETDAVYAEYWKAVTGSGGVQGKIGAATNAARKALGGVDGPMTPTEFANAVTRAIRLDDAATADPFIQKAAAIFKRDIAAIHAHSQKAGVAEPITKGPKFAGGYVPRIFNSRAFAARATEMEEKVFASMKADQERKAVLKTSAEAYATDLETLDASTRKLEGRRGTAQDRLADVESRIAEVAAAAKRGEARLAAADQRVSEIEQEIADIEAALADAKATKDYDKGDLAALEKELSVLRKARDKALRDAEKGAPEAPSAYDRLPDGTLPEGINASRFVGYLTGSRPAPREPSFIRWIVKQGGIKDEGGDIAAAFGGEPPRGLIKKDGLGFDDLAQKYAEEIGIENYKPNEPGNVFEPNDMRRIIADAASGRPPDNWQNTYPDALRQRLKEYEAAQEAADDMRERGLDPSNKQQAIAYLRGESGEGLVGRPVTQDDLDAMGDIPLDPVESFRRADETAAEASARVKASDRVIKTLRNKINAREKTEARSTGRQDEAAVNAKAARSRMDVLLDRAEFYAARDAELAAEFERLSKQKGDVRAGFEKIIDEWEGDTTTAAKAAIIRRAEQEAERQAKIAAGTYEGRGGRLASADAEVDKAIARIIKSDRGKIDAELRTQARDVVQNMIATPEGRLPYEWGETATKEARARAAGGMSGEEKSKFLKERRFPVQDSEILDVLEGDARTIMHSYAHSMIPQAEMARMFDGDVQGAGAIRAIKEEYGAKITEAKTEKERMKLAEQMNADIKAFNGMRDRILGVYALPSDPESLFHRGAMVARQFNYMSKMGSMVLSQIADTGMVVMRHGFGGTLDALGASLSRASNDPKAKKISKLERTILQDSAIGVEMVLGSRALSFAEIATDYGRASKFERGTRSASAAFSFINMSRRWDTELQTIAGIASLRRLMRGVEEWTVKGATKDAEWLAAHNIGKDQARRIWDAASKGDGERVQGVLVPEGRTWADPEAYEMMRVALRQAVDDTIIKAGQDKPFWLSTSTGAVIGQFKTFIIAAQQRILIAGLQQADANMVQGAVTMLALGMLSVALRDLVRDGQLKKRAPGEWAVEGFDYSGLGGWMMEPNNIAEKISGQKFGLRPLMGQQPASKFASRSKADAILGPSLGFVGDMTRIGGAVLNREATHGDVQALRNQIPGQNLIWFRGVMNQIQGGVEAALGIEPPKKKVAQ
jgi:hypothetical protein